MARGEHPRALKSSVMNTAKPAEDPVGLARQMGALDLRSLSIKRTTIRAMTLVAGEDDAGCLSVLSGGTDQTISLWNPRMRRGSNVSSVFTSPAAHDSVTALRHVRGAGAKFLLASASADGMMNVWK
jgi:WD40 repeat protein